MKNKTFAEQQAAKSKKAGKVEIQRESVLTMHAEDFPLETIAQMLKLSVAEVKAILADAKRH